ncbi:hypothetical protein DFQ30_002724 [Apophysomyces sp. BC1015]|nr:hypothetical protein DFQ30_002724 [Apophysomyces sp. BC1015]
MLGSNRSRLVTLTMDGRLDMWDFDSSKQIVFKDQAAANESQVVIDTDGFDPSFDLISSPHCPGLCMVLTSQHVMLFSLVDVKLVPQITIPTKPGSSWTGGTFCGKNRFAIWTQHGDVFDYLLKAPQGVQPGSFASNESQLYYSAKLLRRYTLDNGASPILPGTLTTAICRGGMWDNSDLAAVTFCNRSDTSTFAVNVFEPITELQGVEDERDVMSVTRRAETTFAEIWPLNKRRDPKFGSITSTAPVSSNHLAIGYENGTICVVPIAMALLHFGEISQHTDRRYDVRVFEKAHDGEVTCMIVPEHHLSDHQYLLSGGRDGAVKIWNLIDGKYVASFTVHTLPVDSFIEPAEQTDARIRGCVLSVAKDSSLALISVDSMNCLFIFPGHPCPLTTIQWRILEDYLVLGYSDETVFVWQMQTAHLDRVLTGKSAKDVLEDDRWPVNHLKSSSSLKLNHTKQTVTLRSISSNVNGLSIPTNFAHVFVFNIRRLVNDVYTNFSADSSTEQGPPTVLQPSISSSSFDAVVPELLSFRPDKDDPLDHHQIEDSLLANGTKAVDPGCEWKEKRLELIAAVVSAVVSWNISEAFEVICRRPLSLSKDAGKTISYGLKGANGNLSILAPSSDEKEAWKLSPSMTALRLLSIALLSKAIIYLEGQEARSSDLISGYAMALPAVIGTQYHFPSLSLLRLSKDDILSMIDYWETFLPASSSLEKNGSQMMVRASIVLGLIGCDQPQILNPRVRRSTALSLTLLLSDSDLDEPGESIAVPSVPRTLASMELLSQGFSTWEAYINAAEVLRTLFAYATDPQFNALVNRGAKIAIFEIAKSNILLVMGTLTYDTMHAKNMDERIRCLKIIGHFIRKKPMLLYANVQRVVEAVVKTLDPNVPHMRESVLQSATAILHDLVKTYPFVDFSGSAQKLAIGTLEGASIIYDLRTATRSVVLEGHTGSVTVLSFSPDAKFIATCSILDQTVCVWYSNLSLLGILTSSLSHGLQQNKHDSATSGSQKPYKVFSFAMPQVSMEPSDVIHHVRFDWTSSRGVKLHVCDLVMSFTV